LGRSVFESGELLWTRRIDYMLGKDVPMTFEGGFIQLFGFRERGEYGSVAESQRRQQRGHAAVFPKREPFPRAISMDGLRGALITERQTLHTISMEDGNPVLRFQAT